MTSSTPAIVTGGADGKHVEGDPMIVATAFQRQRFYLFSKREPEDTDEAAQGRCALSLPARLLKCP